MVNFYIISVLALLPILAVALKPPPPPTPPPERSSPPTLHEKLWDSVAIDPAHTYRVDKAVALYLDTKPVYERIEKMRKGGVPAPVVFTLHGRESSWNFRKHMHEGSPLTGRTRWVPKGRPKRGNPPFTFEESAEDALYLLKDMEFIAWTKCHDALYQIEKYNGLGYLLYRPIHSPYLWAGSQHYHKGKYASDGVYDPYLVDRQLGCATLLKRMQERGINIGFR